jgi:hypothetical protein
VYWGVFFVLLEQIHTNITSKNGKKNKEYSFKVALPLDPKSAYRYKYEEKEYTY